MQPPHIAFPAPPLRVLVVDGDPDARVPLREMLRIWHHEVCEATDPAEALALAAIFRPDVALIDAALAGRNGQDLSARLKALPGLDRLAVAVLSGEAGPSPHLIKPADPVMLRRLLGTIRYPAE